MTGEIKRAWLTLGFAITGLSGIGFMVGLRRFFEREFQCFRVSFLVGVLLFVCCIYLYSEIRVSLERERWEDKELGDKHLGC